MGYYELPEEKDAPKMARSAYSRDKLDKKRAAECVAHLVESWRKMAEQSCSICFKPIGWGSRYMVDRDGPNPPLSHALCNWKREEEAPRG